MDDLESNLMASIEEAGTKVKMITGNQVDVKYDDLAVIHLTDAGSLLGSDANSVVGIAMTLMNKPVLKYLMLMTPEARAAVVKAVMGDDLAKDEQLGNSMLQEIGNIFGTTIANTLSRYLERPVTTSPPDVVQDMSGAIVSSIITHLDQVDDHILLISIQLFTGKKPVECEVFLLFDTELSQQLISNEFIESSLVGCGADIGGGYYD